MTRRKLAAYHSIGGDVDALSRSGGRSRDDLSEEECRQLSGLLQRLLICKRGLGSAKFCETAKKELEALVSDGNMRFLVEGMISEEASR